MAAAAKPRQRAAKGHKLPEKLPLNLEITDTIKQTWIIGKEIGSGGFGTVYLGADSKNPKDFDYVIKVEYHANGPLFVEMHCYQKIGKPELLANWTKKKKLSYLGLSPCYGTGSFEYNNSKYRFMVLERYGKDLQKLLEENGSSFPIKTVYLVALSVIDTLEYIHSSGYLHGDIKAANLLLGLKKGKENEIYLVDLGLACKYRQGNDTHKKNAPNPKMAHNGTLVFTSRDAHNGSFARRSDLEILSYNMLQWLSGHLPWEKCKTPAEVQNEKIEFMENKEESLVELFPNGNSPGGMLEFLKYVDGLEFEEEPDYDYCRKILKDNLKKLGCSTDKTLVFESVSKHTISSQASDKENTKKSKPKESRAKRKEKSEIYIDPSMIPTPAMLEIMNKKAIVEKVPKTRKKS